MRIAYIGDSWGTSQHRARALERLGHQVEVFDPRSICGRSAWINRWVHRTGGVGLAWVVEKRLLPRILRYSPDVVWVNQGELVQPHLLQVLRRSGAKLVNYINDDPFRVGREWQRFRLYRMSITCYDLLVVCREPNVAELKASGARRVMRVWMTADELIHKPRPVTDEERARYASEVCFVGTWMPERGPFMAELIARGVPLSIWGDNWHKASEWPQIQSKWRGPGVYSDAYAAAIMMSKICLGLLSRGNRDLHTRRSMEVPALGGLLCAERTPEHMQLYKDREEAVFWDSADECAQLCRWLLADDMARKNIADRGRERAITNGYFNEPVMASILEAACAPE